MPTGGQGHIFGVFDGHGGKETSEFIKANFYKTLISTIEWKGKAYEAALKACFMELDKKVGEKPFGSESGSTACVVLITPDTIYCANSGDSRAILATKGSVEPLSEDHKPNNIPELTRIRNAGHSVAMDRVDGNLAVARAIGDFNYKDKPSLALKD